MRAIESRTRRALAIALVVALATGFTVPPSGAAPFPFDVNGDGVPELVAPDADDDGICEWPAGARTFKGTLTFEEGILVDFSGSTSITADRIVVEPGAILNGNRRQLTRLALIARGSSQGDIFSGGALFIEAATTSRSRHARRWGSPA